MSVNELRLAGDKLNSLRVNAVGNHIFLTSENKQNQALCIGLNRSQAHLLMLYLQEHLGYVSISKDRLDD